MKFSIQNLLSIREWQTHPEVYADALDEIRLADALGYHTAWLAEHHFSVYGTCPSLTVLGAAVARETRRIRIGTAVVIAPFAHPLRIAEEAAMVDVLSGGRLEFGLGRGYQPKEFEGLGLSMERTRERFDESLAPPCRVRTSGVHPTAGPRRGSTRRRCRRRTGRSRNGSPPRGR